MIGALPVSSLAGNDVEQHVVKVVQTVFGRFHHFDLARQLHQRGCLEAIFTAYPRWKLQNEALPERCVRTFPWLMAPLMTKWKLGWRSEFFDREISWLVAETLDRYVAKHLPDCDVFVGISGSGLRTGKSIRARGGRYVCDRGSSHIRFADRILKEEFRRWGQEFKGVDPRSINKELAEYDLADLITVPSAFCRKSFVKEGISPTKIRVIPYGVDLGRFSPPNQRSSNKFEVLFVGQVSFRKGIPYLLEAFQRLQHPRKRLRIVGSILPETREILAKYVRPDVEFLGVQPREVVRCLMGEAHVFVLPSVEDGFGMVLAEAMACGSPVIGSEQTGAPDLIQDGVEGFIVPIRNAAAISERLAQLCDDPALQTRMSQAALARVQTLGGWDQYGEGFVSTVRELCAPSKKPSRPAFRP